MTPLRKIFLALSAMALLSLSSPLAARSGDGGDGIPRSAPEAQGVRSEDVARLFKSIEEKGYEVHGMMVIRNDHVIAEHWWDPYREDIQHPLYSATKTFTAAAIGFAVQEGLLKTSDKVASFFPDLLPDKAPQELESLTVEHLLTMSAGHRSTSYPGSGDEQIRAFLAMDYAHKPGTSFAYNITCSHVLSCILTRVSGLTESEYLKTRLFDPLGIEDVVWEMDADGRSMGNGGSHMKTSDMAKFGIFLKNGGVWNGRRLLGGEWIEAMTTPHIFQNPEKSEEEKAKDDGSQGYGYQTWMGRHDSWRAIGGCNQLIMVIPAKNLIVAVQSNVRDEAGFNSLIYEFSDRMEDTPLPPAEGFDLRKELNCYETRRPVPENKDEYSVKSKVLRYSLDANDFGISGLWLRFNCEGDLHLTIETAGAIHNIPFGLDSWEYGSTDRTLFSGGFGYNMPLDVTPYRTAGICSWTGEGVLSASYISMFNVGSAENLKFKIKGGAITVSAEGPRGKNIVLTGKKK